MRHSFHMKNRIPCKYKARYKLTITHTSRITGEKWITTKYVCGIHLKSYKNRKSVVIEDIKKTEIG